jgi:thioredoxin-related protein
MLKLLFISFIALVFSQSALFCKNLNIDKISKASDKEVVIYLHRIGCSYCNSMSEFTLDEDSIKEYIEKNFNFIEINISFDHQIKYKNQTTGGKYFAKNIGYSFYPATLFLDKEGNVKYAALGYKDEFEFLLILKYVKEGFYKKMSLDAYKKQVGYVKNSDDEITDPRKNAN